MSREITPRHVQILLVLAEAPSHGYAVGKDIEDRTGGAIVLKPGSMYRALHQLLEGGYIEEIATGGSDDERRREYRVTRLGRRSLREALKDYRGLVEAGERLGVIRGAGRECRAFRRASVRGLGAGEFSGRVATSTESHARQP